MTEHTIICITELRRSASILVLTVLPLQCTLLIYMVMHVTQEMFMPGDETSKGKTVCLEGVQQECGKHISNEEIDTSLMCFLILGQECRWFVASVAVGGLQQCGKYISESSAIGTLLCLLDLECGNTFKLIIANMLKTPSRHTSHQLGSWWCSFIWNSYNNPLVKMTIPLLCS